MSVWASCAPYNTSIAFLTENVKFCQKLYIAKLDDGLEGRHNWLEKSMIGAGCGPIMASVLTAEDVVRRIAAECVYVDERGGVGIRLGPAAAIVRQYGRN